MSSTFTLVTAFLLAVGPIADAGISATTDPVLEGCFIKAKDRFNITVPAQETGLLTKVVVSPGQVVDKDALLAQIDATRAKMQRDVAGYDLNIATLEHQDTIRLEYAQKSYALAKKVYEKNKQVNAENKTFVPQLEIDQYRLAMEEAALQVKKIRFFDKKKAKLEVDRKQAEVTAADKVIERHRVTAPFAGVVLEILTQRGEWVEAGRRIVRLMSVDELEIKGTVDSSKYLPSDVRDRPVTVEVVLPNRTERFTGVITHVGNEEGPLGFDVAATIKNKRVGREWVLRDGMSGTMTIHVTP